MAQTFNDYPSISVEGTQNIAHQAGETPTGLWGRWTVATLLAWLKADPQSLLDQAAGDAAYSAIGHDHDLDYSDINHGHAGVYSPVGHGHSDATTGASGFMSGADKTRLDGMADNANNYSHPNHSGDVTSSGDGATVIAANVVTPAKMSREGTAGQVYTSNGPSADGSMQDLPGGAVADELPANAAEDIDAGELCFFNGTWNLAQADAVGTVKFLLGIAKTSVTNGQSLVCTLEAPSVAGFTGLTAGALQYVSPGTAGALTEAKPTGTNWLRIVGYALTATTIRLKPSTDYVQGP